EHLHRGQIEDASDLLHLPETHPGHLLLRVAEFLALACGLPAGQREEMNLVAGPSLPGNDGRGAERFVVGMREDVEHAGHGTSNPSRRLRFGGAGPGSARGLSYLPKSMYVGTMPAAKRSTSTPSSRWMETSPAAVNPLNRPR